MEFIPSQFHSKIVVGDLNKFDKNIEDFKTKRLLEHEKRDLTPKKEEVKFYGKKHKIEGTKNMNEVFGKKGNEKSKLDISGISYHVSKTPPKRNVAGKITEMGNLTPT